MKETMVDTKVTYTVAHRGKLYVIEHVPARVCRETRTGWHGLGSDLYFLFSSRGVSPQRRRAAAVRQADASSGAPCRVNRPSA